MNPFFRVLIPVLLLGVAASAQLIAAEPAPATLKAAAQGQFHIGAALSAAQILGSDRAGRAIVEAQFDTVTPENAMKWEHIHPEPNRYAFEMADKFVEYGVSHGMFVVGHTLMWHSQTPPWVFKGDDGKEISRAALLQRLRDHIHTIVGRYRGKVKGWDVVNEAIRDEDGGLRVEKPWYRILGEEGIVAAFQAAHEADPDAELYYNEYSLENPAKRAGVLKLVQGLRARGLRVDGVGSQEHVTLDWPKASAVDETIARFGKAGFKVMVTELDVTTLPRPDRYAGAEVSRLQKGSAKFDPYRDGLPARQQAKLAKRYGELFAVYAKHAGTLTRVTLWGVTDRDSWLNNWPIRGRVDYPLLWDREGQPKPALAAAVAAVQSHVPKR